MIKVIPTYQTSDGVSVLDIDKALEHERFLMIQKSLTNDRLRLGLALSEVDRIADVIQKTHPAMVAIFAANLKPGPQPVLVAIQAKDVDEKTRLALESAQKFASGGVMPRRPGGGMPISESVVRPDPQGEQVVLRKAVVPTVAATKADETRIPRNERLHGAEPAFGQEPNFAARAPAHGDPARDDAVLAAFDEGLDGFTMSDEEVEAALAGVR